MHILLFILLFLVAIIVFGLSIIGFVIRRLFGFGKRSSSRPKQEYGYSTESNGYDQSNSRSSNIHENAHSTSSGKKHNKIFSDDDGEYVDFEEIKE